MDDSEDVVLTCCHLHDDDENDDDENNDDDEKDDDEKEDDAQSIIVRRFL